MLRHQCRNRCRRNARDVSFDVAWIFGRPRPWSPQGLEILESWCYYQWLQFTDVCVILWGLQGVWAPVLRSFVKDSAKSGKVFWTHVKLKHIYSFISITPKINSTGQTKSSKRKLYIYINKTLQHCIYKCLNQ